MNIKRFANAMQGAGVKPSLFEVQGRIGGTESSLTPFLVKSASLPGTQLGTIEIPYRGRRIKVPGDRVFGDWSITIINDNKFQLRNLFELWVNNIQSMERNVAENEFTNLSGPVFQDWTVNQLDRAGKPVKAYRLIGCFPTDISAIDLSYEATDQIEEFSVTLAYSYFTSNVGTPDASQFPGLTPLTPGSNA
jgi:hypothetical protein